MATVWVVYVHGDEDHVFDLIGVYTSEELATAARALYVKRYDRRGWEVVVEKIVTNRGYLYPVEMLDRDEPVEHPSQLPP